MSAVLAPVALGPRHKGLGDGVGRWRWAVSGTVVSFLRMSVSKARRLWPAGGPLWEAESFLRREGEAGAALEGGCSRGGLLSGPSWPWWGASPHSRFMEEGFICDCVADGKTGSDNRWKRKDLNETPSPPS